MYTKTWNDVLKTVQIQEVSSKGDNSGPFGPPAVYTNNFSLTLPNTKSGSSVPGWRKLIEAGQFAASPYSCSLSRVQNAQSSLGVSTEYTNPGVSQTKESFKGFFRAPALPSLPTFPVEVDNKALSRILGKIRDQVEHVNVLPALGELRSTVRQFGAPAEAILSLSNRYINKLELAARGLGGSTSFRKIEWHRIVASSYLEYVFGLAPLMEDVKKIAEALARWDAEKNDELPRPTSSIFKANVKQKTSTNSTVWGGWLSPAANIGCYDMYTTVTEFGARYSCRLNHTLQADFGSNERLMQLLGFNNPLNFIPTIHEVLPWSWLLDYLLNVQEIIEAGVTDTSYVEWIIRQNKTRIQHSWIGKPEFRALAAGWAPTRPSMISNHLGKWRIDRTAYTRSLPTSLGLPIPVLGYPNSVKKLANATAALFARRARADSMWII